MNRALLTARCQLGGLEAKTSAESDHANHSRPDVDVTQSTFSRSPFNDRTNGERCDVPAIRLLEPVEKWTIRPVCQ